MTRVMIFPSALAFTLLACNAMPVEPRSVTVEVTREVPVTVAVVKEIPVTREVPVTVEVTRIVDRAATAPPTPAGHVVTYQVLEAENFAVWYRNNEGGTNDLELQGRMEDPRFEVTLTVPAGFDPYMMAQNRGQGGCVTCRVLVDRVQWRRSQSCMDHGIATCSRY